MEEKIKELKARAYDLIALREKATQELNQVNQMIAQEMQKQQKKPTEVTSVNQTGGITAKEIKVERTKKD